MRWLILASLMTLSRPAAAAWSAYALQNLRLNHNDTAVKNLTAPGGAQLVMHPQSFNTVLVGAGVRWHKSDKVFWDASFSALTISKVVASGNLETTGIDGPPVSSRVDEIFVWRLLAQRQYALGAGLRAQFGLGAALYRVGLGRGPDTGGGFNEDGPTRLALTPALRGALEWRRGRVGVGLGVLLEPTLKKLVGPGGAVVGALSMFSLEPSFVWYF